METLKIEAKRKRWKSLKREYWRDAKDNLHHVEIKAGCLLFILVPLCGAANYTLSTYSTDPTLYAELIANTTKQYNGTLKKSTYPNLYTFTITSKKPIGPPPITPAPIETGTALDRCFVHGYVFGMEDERDADICLVDAMQADVFKTKTCGGLVANSTSPATAFLNGCYAAYNVIRSTITQRDGMDPPVLVPPFPIP